MQELVEKILNNFDFNYIIIINILTYCIIKIIDEFNGNKKVTTWQKRLVLLFSIIVISIIYYFIGYENKIILINSAFVTPVFWSWVLKPICIKFKIDYKNIDKYLR